MAKSKKQRKKGQVKASGTGFVLILFDDHEQINTMRVHRTFKGAKKDSQATVDGLWRQEGGEGDGESETLEWSKDDVGPPEKWSAVFGGGQGTFAIYKTKIYE